MVSTTALRVTPADLCARMPLAWLQDATHLCEFHQVEGVVLDYNLVRVPCLAQHAMHAFPMQHPFALASQLLSQLLSRACLRARCALRGFPACLRVALPPWPRHLASPRADAGRSDGRD